MNSTFPTGNELPELSKIPKSEPAQIIGISGNCSAKYFKELSASGHS